MNPDQFQAYSQPCLGKTYVVKTGMPFEVAISILEISDDYGVLKKRNR